MATQGYGQWEDAYNWIDEQNKAKEQSQLPATMKVSAIPTPGQATSQAKINSVNQIPVVGGGDSELKKATDIYNSIPAFEQESLGKGGQTSVNAAGEERVSQISRDESIGNRSDGGRRSYGRRTIAADGTVTTSGQPGDMPDLDLGDITLDLPDYKPPAENKADYNEAREQAYQRGRGDMQEQTHNAIIGAKNLDNPNARAQLTNSILRGMGASLTGISQAAGREADTKAARKRADQMNIYNAKFQAESAEAKAKYDTELQESLANFAQDQAEWANDANTTIQGTEENGGDYVGTERKREGGIDYRWAGGMAGWVKD